MKLLTTLPTPTEPSSTFKPYTTATVKAKLAFPHHELPSTGFPSLLRRRSSSSQVGPEEVHFASMEYVFHGKLTVQEVSSAEDVVAEVAGSRGGSSKKRWLTPSVLPFSCSVVSWAPGLHPLHRLPFPYSLRSTPRRRSSHLSSHEATLVPSAVLPSRRFSSSRQRSRARDRRGRRRRPWISQEAETQEDRL